MQVSDCMSSNVRVCAPEDPIRDAARAMREIDVGVLPVGENDRLVGMITDRDIAIRGVGEGKGPDATVREVMTGEVRYCFEDEDVSDVAMNMGDLKVRRLPVVSRDKRLVGIISLGDVSRSDGEADMSGAALSAISEPGGRHTTAWMSRPLGRRCPRDDRA